MTHVPNISVPRIMTSEDKDDGYYEFAIIPEKGHSLSVNLYRKEIEVAVSNGDSKPINAVSLTYSQVQALREALDNVLARYDAV